MADKLASTSLYLIIIVAIAGMVLISCNAKKPIKGKALSKMYDYTNSKRLSPIKQR